MSLLQDVLRSHTTASTSIEKRLDNVSISPRNPQSHAVDSDDSDDEYVNVVSVPGTPARTRSSSPTRLGTGASARPIPGPLHLSASQSSRRDPLKAFPTEVSQKIFTRLPIRDLALCALVSKKWCRSQTINYVWFQHYRKENFHDESLPAGKWTKRESKQNWRLLHSQSYSNRAKGSRSPTSPSGSTGFSRGSGYSSPSISGYQTPKELKEEQWKLEAEAAAKPGKVEMRGMYKDLGGRKSKWKNKLGSSGVRDKGGWNDANSEW